MRSVSEPSQAFKAIIRTVGRGRKLQRDLTRDEAAEAIRLILSGEVSDAQIGAYLITMRVKEETADEIVGTLRGARLFFRDFKPNVKGLVDLGLPYDGKEDILQTGVVAGLIAAAAGVPIVIHGADDIPAKRGVGVLNLMRALGYPADLPPEAVERQIETTNLGVLNIAQFLPQWAALTPLRHHFGLRTLLNTSEKLLDPAGAPIHVSGFYHGSYLHRMAAALPGSERKWVVQGEEGSIDIRPGKKSRVYEAVGDEMVERWIDAAEYGYAEFRRLEMPNDADAHAEVVRRVLDGERGPAFDQIALTAGALLWMVGRTPDIESGLRLAQALILDGAARALLERTVETIP